jgi:methylmalonyl-CoA mutase N-terminal domain/subunit
MAYLSKIDAMGGMQSAIEAGFAQREIHNSAYAQQRMVESGERVIVGVNEFSADQDREQPEILRVDPAVGAEQRARLESLRRKRDGGRVQATLDALRAGARGDANLMPLILDCVEHEATLGEICDTLRTVFGEYKPRFDL